MRMHFSLKFSNIVSDTHLVDITFEVVIFQLNVLAKDAMLGVREINNIETAESDNGETNSQ